MNFPIYILSILITFTLAIEDKNQTSPNVVKPREPRQYNSQFYLDSFGDDVSNELNLDGRSNAPYVTDSQNHGYYRKKFDNFPGYGYAAAPSYANIQSYNGNPFLKKFQADQGGEVMLMMNDINKRQSSYEEEDKGLLSNLDPQVATAIAAIIPLSIIFFAVVPVLVNLFQNGPSVVNLPSFPPVTTIASSRLGRALMDKEYLEERLQDIVDFAVRALEEDSCVQQTMCHQVLNRAGKKNARTAVAVVDYFGRKNWMESLGAGGLIKAFQKGDCESVCGTSL